MRDFSTSDKLQQKELQIQDTSQDRTSNLKLCILEHIDSGIQPADICKIEGISESALQYHLNKLKHADAIRKIGYGTWEVSDTAIFDLKRSTKELQITSNKFKRSTKKEVRKHDRSSNSNFCKGLDSEYRTVDKLQQKEVRNQDTPQGRSTNSNLCIGTNSKYKTADKPSQKEVRNQDRTSNSYLCILQHIYSGIQPATICKLEGIPKTTLQSQLNKLKHAGAIRKIGYGTWEVSDTAIFDLKRSTKTLHVGK